jgi:transposase
MEARAAGGLLRPRSARPLRVGVHSASLLLVAAGDNPERLRSEAAWAHLCGVAPIPASSGKIISHRLNRGGDRQANQALYRIAIVRMRYDAATQTYVQRRQAEGRTKGEITRCLKRYIAREVFKSLPRELAG